MQHLFRHLEYRRLSGVKSAFATTNFCFKATVLSKWSIKFSWPKVTNQNFTILCPFFTSSNAETTAFISSDRQRQYVERQFWNYAPGIDNWCGFFRFNVVYHFIKFLKIVYVNCSNRLLPQSIYHPKLITSIVNAFYQWVLKTPLIWQILQTHLEILKKLLLANSCNAAACIVVKIILTKADWWTFSFFWIISIWISSSLISCDFIVLFSSSKSSFKYSSSSTVSECCCWTSLIDDVLSCIFYV
jgi:hypothetical protein